MEQGSGRSTRRRFLRDAGMVAAAGALGSPAAADAARRRARRASRLPSVAVIGGGMGGLAAAHELIERGFAVTVFERKALGGKARSMPVPGTATGGRQPLPGEHGFRFFPGFYRNVPDTMRRIPWGDNPNGVFDNLVSAEGGLLARAGAPDLVIGSHEGATPIESLQDLAESVAGLLSLGGEFTGPDLLFFVRQMLVYLTSSDERRYGEWEYTPWWQFVRADDFGPAYQKYLAGALTRALVAAKPRIASTHTIGLMGEAFVLSALGQGNYGAPDRLLNAPTNTAWIDPWIALLRRKGVDFQVGYEATALTLAGDRIRSATLRDARGREHTVEPDHVMLAVPVERAIPLLGGDLKKADPRFARLAKLQTDWMNGIQYYFTERLKLPRGHLALFDSQFALTGLSQPQFWPVSFTKTYGDGKIKDILSIDISSWSDPGIIYNKPAWGLTAPQIAREVLAQTQAHLNDWWNVRVPGNTVASWFLDPAITWPAERAGLDRIADNEEQLLINTAGSWDDRPEAKTAIDNLFLCGDYVRNDINLATMEGANEAARRAVNALLDETGSQADGVEVFELYQPPELDGLKQLDADRYRQGLPNILEVPWPGTASRLDPQRLGRYPKLRQFNRAF